MGFTGFYWVLLGFTGFYWVLLGFTGFYWVLLDFTGFYWILLDFTGFYWVFTGFYRVLPTFHVSLATGRGQVRNRRWDARAAVHGKRVRVFGDPLIGRPVGARFGDR